MSTPRAPRPAVRCRRQPWRGPPARRRSRACASSTPRGASGAYYAVTMPSRTLTGWGRISPTRAELAEPATAADAARLLETAARGLIARGLGRSYNNAAQCADGLVISTARMNQILDLDPATGVATCEAGVSLEQLMVAGLPAGWFVPVAPGTRQVTVGGAIAADCPGH